MFPEQSQGKQNQIIKVHGVAGVQGGFVTLGNVLRQRADAGIAKQFGAFAAVLKLA